MPRKRNTSLDASNNDLSRDIGGLEARMKNTEDRLANIESKLDVLVETVAASKGGLRTLIAVGTIVGAITAAISELVHYLSRT